ncbi:MAG: histidine phosphatase family protein, partial [Oscillospiraceae bacterium]
FIRHGITQGNLEGRYIGRTDLPVCDEGRQLLEQFQHECIYPGFDKIYTSPLVRCKQTAEILFPQYTHTIVENFTEVDFGDFENKTMDELKDDEKYNLWVTDAINNPPPNGENSADFLTRLYNAVDFVFKDMCKEGIHEAAVITHGGVIMSLLSAYGLPRLPMNEWLTENGTGFTIIINPQMWLRDRMFEVFAKIPQNIEQLN